MVPTSVLSSANWSSPKPSRASTSRKGRELWPIGPVPSSASHPRRGSFLQGRFLTTPTAQRKTPEEGHLPQGQFTSRVQPILQRQSSDSSDAAALKRTGMPDGPRDASKLSTARPWHKCAQTTPLLQHGMPANEDVSLERAVDQIGARALSGARASFVSVYRQRRVKLVGAVASPL